MQKAFLKVPLPLAQALANLLASLPYGQVYGLVTELQKCETVNPESDGGDVRPAEQ